MEILLDPPVAGEESWAFVKEGDRVELGAQVLPVEYPTELVVIWRAAVAPHNFRDLVRLTYRELRKRSELPAPGTMPVRCRLTGYGPSKEFLQPSVFLTDGELPYFEACRAELETSDDEVVVWANVTIRDDRSLSEAGDNIGMRVPLNTPDGWGAELVAEAVSATREIDASQVRGWLHAATGELLAGPHDPVPVPA